MQEAADYWTGQLERSASQVANIEFLKLTLLAHRGDPDLAERAREWLEIFGQNLNGPESLPVDLTAPVLITAGEYAKGVAMLEELIDLSEPLSQAMVGDDYNLFRLTHWLVFAYQQTGRAGDGEAVSAWADRMLKIIIQDPGFRNHPDRLILPALDHAATGNLGEASSALRVAFESGWRAYHIEKNSPLWRGAWQSPEFKPVVADLLADIERQRQEVETIESGHDFRTEFESLMAKKAKPYQ